MVSITVKARVETGKGAARRERYPTYMIKDGKQPFMFSRHEPATTLGRIEYDCRANQIIENDGAFFRFRGGYSSPLEAIKVLANRYGRLNDAQLVYVKASDDSEAYYDFSCCNTAFRIYDEEYVKRVLNLLETINNKEYQ